MFLRTFNTLLIINLSYAFLVFSHEQDTNSAADVFFKFISEQLEQSGQLDQFEEIMGADWIGQVTSHTSSWTVSDANYFLNTLKEARVDSSHILKILQATSYLQALRDINFEFNQERHITGSQQDTNSVADVFFNFISEQLEKSGQLEQFEEIMGTDWIDQVTLHTSFWTVSDANHFLNTLKEARVNSSHILKILQATNYLQALRDINFEFTANEQQSVIASNTVTEGASNDVVEIPEAIRTPEFTFLQQDFINTPQTGSRIFIEFVNAARDRLSSQDFKRIMGKWNQPRWEERIIKYIDTENWTEREARNFLLFLVQRIGLESALKVIKRGTSYLQGITYSDFIGKVHFYSDELGEDEVNKLLKKSLGGFRNKNSISEIRNIIAFISKYIQDDDALKQFVKKKIIDIASASSEQLKDVADFLINEYSFTKAEIKTLMQGSFDGFARAKSEQLKDVADFLTNEYSFKKAEIKTS